MKTIDTFIQIDNKDQFVTDIATGFQKSRILFTSLELGIFTIIGNESKSAEKIAEESNCKPESLEKLLNTLVNMQLLNKKYNEFSNKVNSLLYLSKESPNYLGDLLHIASLWDNWSNLTDTVRNGEPTHYQSINEKDNEWIEAYILASYRASKSYINHIFNHIPLSNPRRMLDLGARSANHSIQCAKLYPRLDIIAFDYPRVIEITQKFINRSGLSDRISTLSGDFLTDDIGNEYDFVFMADIISQSSFKTNIELLRKVYDSMNFGGVVAIMDSFYDDNKTGPEEANLLSLNMMVNTMEGEVLNDTDIWFAMREAWFSDIYKIRTNFGKSIIIGKK
ncbi:MAG: hypothetical protein A2X64_01610 [Ignavibacteria bacterium GWF2_33_9]|nr:MAG: hypothetical protein A2X64_01610 [Ignavibacteria bacterium GWF2_33_9]